MLTRLEHLCDHLFIDEVQDLAGYDLELLKLFLSAKFSMTMVGDYRQATLSTNQSAKHKKYRYAGIIDLFKDWEKKSLCTIEYASISHRCNQKICNFADLIFPDAPNTTSENHAVTGHDGVFLVSKTQVHDYLKSYQPRVLRHSKSSKCMGYSGMNFGISKGQTFERTLIFPTTKIKKYLETGNPLELSDRELFYVSVTRSKQSVAFVYDGDTAIPTILRYAPE